MVALFGYLSEALRKRPQAPRRVQLQGAHLFGVSNCARADCSGRSPQFRSMRDGSGSSGGRGI